MNLPSIKGPPSGGLFTWTLALLLCALWLFAFGAGAAETHALSVPTDRWSSSSRPLPAFWFQAEPRERPGPAVLLLHGCGGAYGRSGDLSERHRMWAEYLASIGYHALVVDSFTPRGVKEICTQRHRDRTIRESDRAGDAYAALAYLRQTPGVDPARIAVLGWSHGGSVTLQAVTNPPLGAPRFAAAVALYPGCAALGQRPAAFAPYSPLLILMGESDDWTPAEPCKQLASAAAARGLPVQIHTYANTFHDFDNPSVRGTLVRKDVPSAPNAAAGVTMEPNPEAREDAKLRVQAFLEKTLH